jgi:hypothetical protein
MMTLTIVRHVVLPLTFVIGIACSAAAQETVTVGLPSSVTFAVGTASTVTGNPDPTTVTFSNATLTPGRALQISVMADSSAFSGPGGPSYPAGAASWTVSNVSGGSASSGTLSSGSYTQVFQSNTLTSSGGFDLRWTLTPAGGGDYAGVHSLTLRWKLESVQP